MPIARVSNSKLREVKRLARLTTHLPALHITGFLFVFLLIGLARDKQPQGVGSPV